MANPTVQQVVDRALDRSGMSDVNLVNVPSAISIISTEQRRAYLIAGRLDPEYYGVSAVTSTRTHYTDPWDLDVTPGNVAVVSQAFVTTIVGTVTGVTAGDKVHLVWSRTPALEVAPRAFLRGRKIIAYNNELGGADANMVTVLTVWYSPLPTVLTATTDTLTLPDEWQGLVVLPLAKMLAIRDQRPEEVPLIDAEYKDLVSVYSEAVLSFSHGMRRPLAQVSALPLGGK